MGENAVTVASAAGAGAPAAQRRRRFRVAVPRLSLQACVALTAVPLVLIAFALPLVGNHMAYPFSAAVFSAYLVAAPLTVGLIWWRKRPETTFGPLLVAFGIAAWPLSWRASTDPLVYTLGAIAEGGFLLLNFFIILAFPTGRLAGGLSKVLMLVLAAVTVSFFAAEALFQPVMYGSQPLFGCGPACPENVFQVGSNPDLNNLLGRAVTYVGAAVVLAIIVMYVGRVRRATRPQRRNLMAVAGSSLLLLPAYAIYYVSLIVVGVGPETAEALGWLVVVAQVVFPLGFALALLQAELFAGHAQRRLLVEAARRPTPAAWCAIVADALDDPSLRLAFWDPERERYREPDGSELAAPAPGSGRQWVDVRRDGDPVAAMVTDAALAETPELVDAAVSATLLAVEHGHLEGELRAMHARAVVAGDVERRRIGQDLHDSAQQRLVALRVHLALAGQRLERPEDQAVVGRLGDELDEALAELQTVTHGLYPQQLARYGIAGSLRTATLGSALSVEIRDEGIRRHAPPIELCVYFCCLEALQNTGKHAGEGASATVRLWEESETLHFEVTDDGVGFSASAASTGDGLANIAERLAVVAGKLDLDSAPGRGTRVAGAIPA